MANQNPAISIPSTVPEEPLPSPSPAKRPVLSLVDADRIDRALKLPSGRTVTAAENSHEQLVIRSPSGEVELTIGFTAQGPVLRFASAALELTSPSSITMECARLHLHAREHLEISSDGDIHQKAQQRQVLEAGVQLQLEAPDIFAQATQGQVQVEAVEDVVLHGDRVRLNC